MISRSYTNLLDLASGNFPVMGRERSRRLLPRVMTVPGNVSEFDDDDQASSDNLSSVSSDRMIIVSNRLPLKSERRNDDGTWSFTWDQDSLYLQLKDGFPEDMEVFEHRCRLTRARTRGANDLGEIQMRTDFLPTRFTVKVLRRILQEAVMVVIPLHASVFAF